MPFSIHGEKNYCAVLKRCIRCISYVTQSVIYAIRFGNINNETEVRKPSRKGGILNLEGDPTTGDLKDRSRDETRRMPLQGQAGQDRQGRADRAGTGEERAFAGIL